MLFFHYYVTLFCYFAAVAIYTTIADAHQHAELYASAAVLGPCTTQQQKPSQQLPKSHLVGVYKPQCQRNGNYKPMQCNFATNFCWCVVPDTGRRIVEPFRLTSTEDVPPDYCYRVLQYFTKKNRSMQPSCEQQQRKADVLPGQFVPACTKYGGFYKRLQCHASTGMCWCVDVFTGAPVSEKFRPWKREYINCRV